MPLYNYRCGKCSTQQEHFLLSAAEQQLTCPKCDSTDYNRTLTRTLMNVEYTDSKEHDERKIKPVVDELYAQIGREALTEDTKTLDNLFGTDKVEKTFYQYDD